MRETIYKSVRTAYLSSAKTLLDKLPLGNAFLQSVTALDPSGDHDPQKLESIVSSLDFVIREAEKDQAEDEIRGFSVDKELPSCQQEIISWWEEVGIKYPHLKKVAVAALSCFHGPMVESSFNHMKDVIDNKAGSMDISTFSACQSVKYHLKSASQTAVSFFARKEISHTAIDPKLVQNMCSSASVHKKQMHMTKQQNISTTTCTGTDKLQTCAAAKRVREKVIRKSHEKHQAGVKRRAENPLPSQNKRRKRC